MTNKLHNQEYWRTLPKASYNTFGKSKFLPVYTIKDGEEVKGEGWLHTLWWEREEDGYALLNPQYKGQVVRVVTRDMWLQSI